MKTFENIEWRKPRKTPTQVWREYGVPVVSKEYSRYNSDVREGSSVTQTQKRLNFRNSYSLPKNGYTLQTLNFLNQKYQISVVTILKNYLARTMKKKLASTLL